MRDINELDKNKTEQSITNERIRLDNCRITLDKLKAEYGQKRYHFINVILAEMEDKILALENSISSGEKFIEACENHLKDFE